MGYDGRLRARGHVLADQYAMARRSGFDEVEISDDLAARQPEDQWLARAGWKEHDYQARLRGWFRFSCLGSKITWRHRFSQTGERV